MRIDGVKDGVIEDPKRCKFDPACCECKGADGRGVPDDAAGQTARLIYIVAGESEDQARDHRSRAGQRARMDRPGLDRSRPARPASISSGSWCSRIPTWTSQKFNFDTDIVRAEETDADTINALDPNLKPFFDRGGKLIQYHGWSDPQISPGNSVAVLQARRGRDRRRGQGPGVAIGCSWRPAWRTAAAARDRTRSTWWPRSSSGWSRSRRRIRSWRHGRATARSIERARCARIRRSRPTREPEAPTKRRISFADSFVR